MSPASESLVLGFLEGMQDKVRLVITTAEAALHNRSADAVDKCKAAAVISRIHIRDVSAEAAPRGVRTDWML